MKFLTSIFVSGALSLFISAAVFAHADLEEQIAELSACIQKEPKNAALYFKRGEVRQAHAEWEEALSDFDRTARLDPAFTLVDLARAKTLLEAHRPFAAKAAVDRFLTREPTHPEGFATRARILMKMNQPIAAAEDFTRALSHAAEPSVEIYLERAQALTGAGPDKMEEALRGLDEGIARLGPLVTLQLPAIDLELKRKEHDAALRRLDRLLAQSPRKEGLLARRGEILKEAGRAEEAYQADVAALAAIEALSPQHRRTQATMELESKLRLEIANKTSTTARLSWSSPSTPKAIIPQSRLYP